MGDICEKHHFVVVEDFHFLSFHFLGRQFRSQPEPVLYELEYGREDACGYDDIEHYRIPRQPERRSYPYLYLLVFRRPRLVRIGSPDFQRIFSRRYSVVRYAVLSRGCAFPAVVISFEDVLVSIVFSRIVIEQRELESERILVIFQLYIVGEDNRFSKTGPDPALSLRLKDVM